MKSNFFLLFDLQYTFNLRRYKINRTVETLLSDLIHIPNNSTRRDIQWAIEDNSQAEEKLRKHFLQIWHLPVQNQINTK